MDAAWEMAITVTGALVVAGGACSGSFFCRRAHADPQQTERGTPLRRDGPSERSKNEPVVGQVEEQEQSAFS